LLLYEVVVTPQQQQPNAMGTRLFVSLHTRRQAERERERLLNCKGSFLKKKEKVKYICSNGICVVSKKNMYGVLVLNYFFYRSIFHHSPIDTHTMPYEKHKSNDSAISGVSCS
ncbi:hypothetical protein ACJX0J_040147, partial [Zea mays]